jgi:hypothetical protein
VEQGVVDAIAPIVTESYCSIEYKLIMMELFFNRKNGFFIIKRVSDEKLNKLDGYLYFKPFFMFKYLKNVKSVTFSFHIRCKGYKID